MTSRLVPTACITLLLLGLPALASADQGQSQELDLEARQKPGVERELQPPLTESGPARSIVPGTPAGWGDPPGELAIEDWQDQNPYGYGTDYLFPLTRDLTTKDLALWAKIPIYPIAALYDLVQLPFGAIGGLWGK